MFRYFAANLTQLGAPLVSISCPLNVESSDVEDGVGSQQVEHQGGPNSQKFS